MFLINATKPKEENKLKLVLFFAQLFRGGESEAYKIKPVLFLFPLRFIQKKRENNLHTLFISLYLLSENVIDLKRYTLIIL